MKKYFYFLLALMLFAGAVHAQFTEDRTVITLERDVPSSWEDDLEWGPVITPEAFLSSSDILYIDFDFDGIHYGHLYAQKYGPTKLAITTESNDTLLYQENTHPTGFDVLMNETGIPDGEYTLNVFYYGFWWTGEFEFKSHKPKGLYVSIDSTYYRLHEGYANTVWPDDVHSSITYRMLYNLFERDYPIHVVIPSELTYEGETYQVTGIGQRSFKGCYYMQSISLPNTITYIDHGAFMACKNLDHVNIPESVTRIEGGVFAECDKLSYMVIPEGIETLAYGMFNRCINLSAVTLPGSLTSIEEWAFAGCTALPYIEIPDNVASIGEAAFQACENLMEIKLPKKLARIEKFTFRGCKLLNSIEIPERVRSIGTEAFAGCTSLTSVTLPEGMTSIDELAFTDLPNTAHIYCKAQKPFRIADRSFNYNCTLHVPQGCKEAYEEADFWKNFTTIVEDEDTKDNEAYIFAGDMTGVEPAVEAESAERFYDLQGRPVDGTQKGVLIRNGRKVLIK